MENYAEDLDKVVANVRLRILDVGKKGNFFSKETARRIAWEEIRRVYKNGLIDQIDDQIANAILEAESLRAELDHLTPTPENAERINFLRYSLGGLERRKEELLSERRRLEEELASLWSVEVQEEVSGWKITLRCGGQERKVVFSRGVVRLFRG